MVVFLETLAFVHLEYTSCPENVASDAILLKEAGYSHKEVDCFLNHRGIKTDPW